MSSTDYDRPPRDDILPSPEEIRRTPVSTPPHPDELDAPDDLKLDEEHITRAKMPPVTWAQSDNDAPDYAHLVPKGREPVPGDKNFKIGAADIELLIKANGFDPKGPDNRIVFAFRGANLIDRSDKNNDGAVAAVDSIELEETRPDHKNFRCVIGYLNRTTGKISAFRASTVPNVKYMTNYYMWNNGLGGNSGTGANMMPTGCYVFRMGAHGGGRIYPALRMTDPEKLAEDGAACVLRSKNDLTFKSDDFFDHCTPYDNIHCAYAYDSFSSAGCQTIQGPNGEGPWGHFQAVLKTVKVNTRMDYVLLTGREASIAAWLRDTGKAGDADLVARWLGRLRPGSRGDAVNRLQERLGMAPSGYFGPSTKKKLVELQRSKKLLSDGIWSPIAEESIGWPVFKPAAAPQPAPSPTAPSAVSSQPVPAPQPEPIAAPSPTVGSPPSAAPAATVGEAAPAAAGVAAAPAGPTSPPAAPSPSTPLAAAIEPKPIPPVPSMPAAASPAAARPKPTGVSEAVAAELEKLTANPKSAPDAPGGVDSASARARAAAGTRQPQLRDFASVTSHTAPAGSSGTATAGTRKLVLDGRSIEAFARNARPEYREALLAGNELLTRYGINQTPIRLSHFLGQIGNECGRLTILDENMTYRSAARLKAVWPTRFPTLASAEPFVNKPQELAEKVYGGRFDNRPGDGWRYRGRGLVQITGRSSYREMGRKLGIPLEDQPDLACDPKYALAIACETWAGKTLAGERDMNRLADANKLEAMTYRINGGYTNIDDRRDAFEEAWEIWGTGKPPRRSLEPDTLDRGDRAGRVEELNAQLEELRLFESVTSSRPQQVFNLSTYKAVRALQEDAGLNPTGVVGTDTWSALEKAIDRGGLAHSKTQDISRSRSQGVESTAPRDPVTSRLREIQAWSVALALLAVAFVIGYVLALNSPTGNTPLWMPLVYSGMVFVTGLALWLAARPQPNWNLQETAVRVPGARTRQVRRPTAFVADEEEPVRMGTNLS